MAFKRGRFHRRNKKLRGRFAVLFSLALLILLYMIFNLNLAPAIKTTATNKAKTVAVNTINEAVGTVLENNNFSYDSLLDIEKDGNGSVTSVESNTIQINLLKYNITKEVISELSAAGSSDMSIPVGTIIGGQIFAGRGPSLPVRFEPVGNVEASIATSFTSAGINQTRMLIMMNIKATISVLIAPYSISATVESNYTIADSIIVGSVPEFYAIINSDGSYSTSSAALGISS